MKKEKNKMLLSRFLRHIAVAAAILTGPILPAQAQDTELNIMTGGPTGTYIQFGRDMAGLMEQCGQTLNVVESAGSLENFLGVRQRSNTQFGIVQNDVLEYMQTFAADDPAVARAITGVRIAFPLYEEEVHILARNDIPNFQGLAGKKVAIGVENSGTFLTASLMLSLAGIELGEAVQLSPADALPELKAGNIDAFFYVAGAPAAIYTDGAIDGSKFHLLPISDPTLSAVYTATTIPAGTYDFQTEAVDLLAVKAVLMTYEYNPNMNAYHRAACKGVSDLSSLILTRLDDLRANGHPKWKDVDLADIPPGWDIGSCVNRGIDPGYAMTCTAPAAPAAAIESEANEAYRRSICAAIGC
ncbi:MAG: TAXI family TRAP transporter solute-binding subunit [Paracoccus sp. (in: a-proteobacteria)]|nr:TAXI family TRAP transporter solute-binding subunit [Paracoccus sp. (in: a-proteobacteria)]